jgi:hypothetical protein
MGTEGEEIQTKGIDSILEKIITQNFSNFEKEKDITTNTNKIQRITKEFFESFYSSKVENL